jgi:hypothetical protein
MRILHAGDELMTLPHDVRAPKKAANLSINADLLSLLSQRYSNKFN